MELLADVALPETVNLNTIFLEAIVSIWLMLVVNLILSSGFEPILAQGLLFSLEIIHKRCPHFFASFQSPSLILSTPVRFLLNSHPPVRAGTVLEDK